ncbi:hypothetical protein MLD38_029746 [Melastoma candidum]|uniref:Uncharacterized protein n=1 Tax=Melastoma candidum TaxID=119954 RepID=A0ACB9N721_9MYRT|nr:hypothetical protein MLD38_029746 [Melastoma candidum]
MPSSHISVTSQLVVHPSNPGAATHPPLRLSASDLPMLSCHYIQKGVLLPLPPPSLIPSLPSLFRRALSSVLSLFPPLASRLSSSHHMILPSSAGVPLVFASAPSVSSLSLADPVSVPSTLLNDLFLLDRVVSYHGHALPLLAVKVTVIVDGIFVGISANHAVVDGTSFWHFFNSFASVARTEATTVKILPDFSRDGSPFDTAAVLSFPAGGPAVSFSQDEPIRERIFHFSRESILKLKELTNKDSPSCGNWTIANNSEIMGKQSNDKINVKIRSSVEISSFQSLCALMWQSVTRARKLSSEKTTTFRMAVNCRHRVEPKMDPFYFGNAIQSTATVAKVGEVLSNSLGWSAGLLHDNVVKHGNGRVRQRIAEWEADPRVFPLGNFDGASMTMGSSPRFPMYNNDFGWGKPVAVRSGAANKFDGKMSAFPGREGDGSVDLEVVLCCDAMDRMEADAEFMQYCS